MIIEGKAIGRNFNPGGQSFGLFNVVERIGISVWSQDMDLGYTFNENDNLRITGTLGQFRGLAQIEATAIEVLPAGGPNPELETVTVLNESSESKLVIFENARLVDPGDWQTTGFGSGFNVEVTNGSETLQVRIDADTDIAGMEAPQGTFSVVGMGGQFDVDEPLDDGYQLLPRFVSDINPFNTGGTGGGPEYTLFSMEELREDDANGIPMLMDELVEITSVVYGVDRREGDGLLFTIINEDNLGVGIFSFDTDFGYVVEQGDMITVRGTLGHFNGLTQIVPDTLWRLSSDNQLVEPRLVNQLNEDTESTLIYISPSGEEDPAQWLGDGTDFNVNFLNDNNEVLTVRIEDHTDLSTLNYPGSGATWYFGIGGQFDGDDPRDSGYQLLPRDRNDVVFYLSTDETLPSDLKIYPNPTQGSVSVEDLPRGSILVLSSVEGNPITKTSESTIDLSGLLPGVYVLEVITRSGQSATKKIVKR